MLKRFVAFAFVSASLALAGEHWNVDAGDVSMKFLSMQVSARSAALSGAGTADAKSPSEISRNPLAMGAVQESEAGVNHVIFPENTADDFSTAYFALPFTLFDFPLTFSAGAEYLGYDEIEGRDEEGFKNTAPTPGPYRQASVTAARHSAGPSPQGLPRRPSTTRPPSRSSATSAAPTSSANTSPWAPPSRTSAT